MRILGPIVEVKAGLGLSFLSNGSLLFLLWFITCFFPRYSFSSFRLYVCELSYLVWHNWLGWSGLLGGDHDMIDSRRVTSLSVGGFCDDDAHVWERLLLDGWEELPVCDEWGWLGL